MSTLEITVGFALRMVRPLWAIQQVWNSKVTIQQKHILCKQILGRLINFSKSKNSQTAEALVELFWAFWIFSDLDNALICLQHLAKCEAKDREKEERRLNDLVSLFLIKFRRDLDLFTCD